MGLCSKVNVSCRHAIKLWHFTKSPDHITENGDFNNSTCLFSSLFGTCRCAHPGDILWWADSVECRLPTALVFLLLHFLTSTCVCNAVCVCETPEDIWRADQTQCYQKEKGSFILDTAAWAESFLWKDSRQSFSLLFITFFPFLFTLGDSLWLH